MRPATGRPAGVYGKVEGRVCPIPTNFDLQHPIQQRHQNFYVLAKLRVELVAQGIVVVEGALRALGGGREMRVVLPTRGLQFLGQLRADDGPARVDTRTIRDGGIVQVILQGSFPCPRTAQRRLDVILHPGRHGINALAQRVERTGQRPCGMDGAGAAFKKAAVPGLRVGRQPKRRQAGRIGHIAFAEGRCHDAGRQPQSPRNAVEVIPGQHQIPPFAATIAATCAGKIKCLPCCQVRAAIPVFTAAARLHVDSRHSCTSPA